MNYLISTNKNSSKTNFPEDEQSIPLDQVFIIVSGAGDEEIAVRAMKQGASVYLFKDNDFSFLAFFDITVINSL